MRRLAFVVGLAGLAAGCAPATGTIVEVQGPMTTTSTAAGVTALELVVGYQSWCDRWIQDDSASRMRADVSGRDLDKKPYDFLVAPSHQTNLTQPVYYSVLAYSATNELLGIAPFGIHPFAQDQVFKHQARLRLFDQSVQKASGPKYVSDDGCVCVPGQPWLGTTGGTATANTGCNARVITSFARLGDTAGCELTPKGAPLPIPVCDGQQYGDEPTNRDLPCFAADAGGACRMTSRRCADHDGTAWAQECISGGGDFAEPAGSQLCAKYLACEQSACGDVTGCFATALGAPTQVTCTVHVDPTTQPGQPVIPCGGAMNWTATFPMQTSQSCVGALVQGTVQPPYTLGFAVAGQTGAQLESTACPLGLEIDGIDEPYPMAVPKQQAVDVVLGEHLVRVNLLASLECVPGGAALTCRLGAP